jgi:hypothetical protein
MGQHGQIGRVKQTVKGGVVAEQVTAQGISADKLREMGRDMVESGIVRLYEAYKKEHLTGPDVDLLQRYFKLLNELEGKIPTEPGQPGSIEGMTDDELAKAAK